MARRVLIYLSQLLHDPASGAARSMRAIADLLASQGFEVRAIASTATETARRDWKADEALAELDLTPRVGAIKGTDLRVLEVEHNGVAYQYLDTPGEDQFSWEEKHAGVFNGLLNKARDEFRPDVVFTYGGMPGQLERRKFFRQKGAAVVAAVFNHGHYHPHAFQHTDAVYSCSEYLSGEYRRKIGLKTTAIPQPIDPAEVVADEHDPIFVTYVNPSVEKGVALAATLFERLGTERPDIPVLVVEARGTAGTLAGCALAGGFDLRRHESIMISPAMPTPKAVFAPTRLLIAPSLWHEPAGRVGIEAMMNSVPPIVSDRGGLAETCLGAASVVRVPEEITEKTRLPVAPEVVEPWLEHIVRLTDDQAAYDAAAAEAGRLSAQATPEALAPRYAEFFSQVRQRPTAPEDLFELV